MQQAKSQQHRCLLEVVIRLRLLEVGLALESGLAHGIQDKLVLEERLHERPEGSMKHPLAHIIRLYFGEGEGERVVE